MKAPSEVVKMLVGLSDVTLNQLAPKGMIVKNTSHSTAYEIYIYLQLEDEKPLLIWRKTNWCSSSYEFNERGKVAGLQPNCEFTAPMLNKFFSDAEEYIKDQSAKRKLAEEEAEQALLAQQSAHIAKYAAAFSQSKEQL